MPLPIQVPDGTVVLSNRFGDGPFDDCPQFIQVVLPQGVETEGVYNECGAGSAATTVLVVCLCALGRPAVAHDWHAVGANGEGRDGDAGELGADESGVTRSACGCPPEK
jgi:hypothetical protein